MQYFLICFQTAAMHKRFSPHEWNIEEKVFLSPVEGFMRRCNDLKEVTAHWNFISINFFVQWKCIFIIIFLYLWCIFFVDVYEFAGNTWPSPKYLYNLTHLEPHLDIFALLLTHVLLAYISWKLKHMIAFFLMPGSYQLEKICLGASLSSVRCGLTAGVLWQSLSSVQLNA